MICVQMLLVLASVAACAYAGSTMPFENFSTDGSEIFAKANENISNRLPNHTHPETYDIAINTRIDLSQFDFIGHVRIGILVDEQTRQIVLHCRQLEIFQVNLFRLQGNSYTKVELANYVQNDELDFLIIETDNVDLNPGDRILLEIVYNGTLRSDFNGFTKSSYGNADGSKTYVIIF